MIYKLIWSLLSSSLLTVNCFYSKFPDFYANIFPLSSFLVSILFLILTHNCPCMSLCRLTFSIVRRHCVRVAISRKEGKYKVMQETKEFCAGVQKTFLARNLLRQHQNKNRYPVYLYIPLGTGYKRSTDHT